MKNRERQKFCERIAPDREEQDAYILDVDEKVEKFTREIVKQVAEK